MKTGLLLVFIAAMSIIESRAEEPGWSPGALAMRCGSSGWKLADFFNDEGNAIDLPPSTPRGEAGLLELFEEQLPDLTVKLGRRLMIFKRAPGSYELGTVAGVTIPAHCETRLVTRIYNLDGEEKVFFDEHLFALLPEPERRLVVLRTAYSGLVNDPFQSDAKLLFQSLTFGRPLAKDLPEWVQLQTRLVLSPQLHGVPVSFKDGEVDYDLYFAEGEAPRSFLGGYEFTNLRRVMIHCPKEFDPYVRSREEFVRYCSTSADEFLDSPSTRNFPDLFGIFKNVTFRSNFNVWSGEHASGEPRWFSLNSWAPKYDSKKIPLDAEFTTPWSSETQWTVHRVSLASDLSSGNGLFLLVKPTVLKGFDVTVNPSNDVLDAEWTRETSSFEFPKHAELSLEGHAFRASSAKMNQNKTETYLRGERVQGDLGSFFPSDFIRTGCRYFENISFERPPGKAWAMRYAEAKGNCPVELPGSPWLKGNGGSKLTGWDFSYNRDGTPTVEFDNREGDLTLMTKDPLPQWPGVFSIGSSPMQAPITKIVGNSCAEGTTPVMNVFQLFGKRLTLHPITNPEWSSCEHGSVKFALLLSGRYTSGGRDRTSVVYFPDYRIRTLGASKLQIYVAKNREDNRIELQVNLGRATVFTCPDGKRVEIEKGSNWERYTKLIYTEKTGLRLSPEMEECTKP